MRIFFLMLLSLNLISCVPAKRGSQVQSVESIYRAPDPGVYAFVHEHDDHWHSHHTKEQHWHPNMQWDLVEVEFSGGVE